MPNTFVPRAIRVRGAQRFKMAATEKKRSCSFNSPDKGPGAESADLQKNQVGESEGQRMRQFRVVMKKCVDKMLVSGNR